MILAELARHYPKSMPAIRNALWRAATRDEPVETLPRKMPRRGWIDDHAAEVARLMAERLRPTEIAQRLDKSDTPIRPAVQYAERHPEKCSDEQE
jgi:hypothetical protein